SLGVGNYDVCFVTISNDFQSSLETTCLLKDLGAKFVVARAERDGQAKLLLRNGADEVVYPEKQVARWAAIRYSNDNILDYIELDGAYSIFEVSVPKAWAGLSVGQIDVRKKYNINIMAIKSGGKISVSVTPDTVLTEDKTMIVLGDFKALQKCFRM
ncbi:MAG: TrkA family potassium uptake protein, partial [Clostridia bacterium]|nr:TrkA family potassium uptake protein [Clostridia bacterium]